MSVSNTTNPVKEIRRQWASISLITPGSSILAIILTSPPHLPRLLVCSKDRFSNLALMSSSHCLWHIIGCVLA
jgi:hypothetical protein